MDKHTYAKLNGAEVDLGDYDTEPLSQLEQRAIRRRIKHKLSPRRNRVRGVLIACLCACFLILGTGLLSMDRVVMAAIPILIKVPGFSYLMEEYMVVTDHVLREYTTTVGETVEDKGISIRLEKVVLDNGLLIVTTTATSDKVELAPTPFLSTNLFINGEEIYSTGGGGNINILEDGTLSAVRSLDLGSYVPEGELHLVMEFTQVQAADGSMITGQWGFAVDTSVDQLAAATTVIPIDKYITLDNGQVFLIENLTVTPLSNRLNYQHIGGSTYDIKFEVEDQDGNKINPRSGRSMALHSHFRYPTQDEEVTSLIFTPHLFSGEEGTRKTDVQIPLPEERFEVQLKP